MNEINLLKIIDFSAELKEISLFTMYFIYLLVAININFFIRISFYLMKRELKKWFSILLNLIVVILLAILFISFYQNKVADNYSSIVEKIKKRSEEVKLTNEEKEILNSCLKSPSYFENGEREIVFSKAGIFYCIKGKLNDIPN